MSWREAEMICFGGVPLTVTPMITCYDAVLVRLRFNDVKLVKIDKPPRFESNIILYF